MSELRGGTLTLSGYIDRLLATDAFASDVAPLIILRQLLGQNALGAPQGFVLRTSDGPQRVYYLHEPCSADEAVTVLPWWNAIRGTQATIKICPDSYRPDLWTAQAPAGEPEIACLSETSQLQLTGEKCGCGPDLIRCFESEALREQVARSMRDELRQTVAYNVVHDLPIERIFTSNETFRDRYAEFLMRSYVAENARKRLEPAVLGELASWPKAGKWAARVDLASGQNAGILTAPQLIHFQLDRRQRMTGIYDVLWCIEADSVGATPETLLSIVGADLQIRSDGWKDLAARPICTNCHARLDYGLQFFWGFANDNLQSYFVPGLQQSGTGPLYVRDIDDRRGEADLTARGFATLAVRQPEFRHCMAKDFAEFVRGNQVTPAHVDAVERGIRGDATSVRDIMRSVLLAFAADWPASGAAIVATGQPASLNPGGARPDSVAMAADLQTELSTRCLDCHDSDHEPDLPDLSTPHLPRAIAISALQEVAFGTMPKDDPLPEPERTRVLERLIDSLWSGADRASARSYFIDRNAAIPAFRPELTLALIHQTAHADRPASWRMMENAVRSDRQQVTPGLATVMGIATIEACSQRFEPGAERSRCITDTLRLDLLSPADRR
jgi:hypothetical protein